MKQEIASLARQLRLRVAEDREFFEDMAAPTAAAPTGDKKGGLNALKVIVSSCRKCPLGNSRLNAVFGVGSENAETLFIGEGPGFQEDHDGEPFVGKSGQLLDKILAAIGLSRESVYIANIVKCHPMINPENPEARGNDRPPSPEEIAACRPYLDQQIALIAPRVIVTLGAVAARVLLGTTVGLTKIRGQWRDYHPALGRPVKVMPTYHPAALLRNPNLKKEVWEDMKNLKKELSTPRDAAA